MSTTFLSFTNLQASCNQEEEEDKDSGEVDAGDLIVVVSIEVAAATRSVSVASSPPSLPNSKSLMSLGLMPCLDSSFIVPERIKSSLFGDRKCVCLLLLCRLFLAITTGIDWSKIEVKKKRRVTIRMGKCSEYFRLIAIICLLNWYMVISNWQLEMMMKGYED